jgi:hypothetical protein
MFKYVGDKFQNERGMYVSVQNKENIVVTKNVSERWNVRYVKNEQSYQTGEYHPGYGFYCNRDFFIVSKRDQRYLQSIGSKAMTKTRNGQATQKW